MATYPRVVCPSVLGTGDRPGPCGRTVAAIPIGGAVGWGRVADHKRAHGDLVLCPGSAQRVDVSQAGPLQLEVPGPPDEILRPEFEEQGLF